MCERTRGGPGLDVSCTVDDYILRLSFLGGTQAVPDGMGNISRQN